MDEGVQDVFSTNPYLDPYQMRQLNKRYRRDTQKLFCEAPVSLREALKIRSDIGAIARLGDYVGMYMLYYKTNRRRVIHIHSVDSLGNDVGEENYNFPYEERLLPPNRFIISEAGLLKQTKLQFLRFDLGTVAKVLLHRGCNIELVLELSLLDVESAKNDIKDETLLELYFDHSAHELDLNGSDADHDQDDPEELVRRRLKLFGR